MTRDIQGKRTVMVAASCYACSWKWGWGATEVEAEKVKCMAFVLIFTHPVHVADIASRPQSFSSTFKEL